MRHVTLLTCLIFSHNFKGILVIILFVQFWYNHLIFKCYMNFLIKIMQNLKFRNLWLFILVTIQTIGHPHLASRVGNSNPLQYTCLEKSHEQWSLMGSVPWDHKELDTTEHACIYTWLRFLSSIANGKYSMQGKWCSPYTRE